jgi:hypothetical protein
MFSRKIVTTSRFIALGAIVVAAAACGSNGDASNTCPNDAPQSCPAAIPSYAHDVTPIIEQACLSCHGPGGPEGNVFPLQDYNDVYAKREAVMAQVASCQMPQPGGDVSLDANDRVTLLTWLVCHAPNN